MAAKKRKKRKKRTTKQTKGLQMELTGLLLIFIAIFGSGAAMLSGGAIPDWLGNIFQFFMGIWHFLIPVALFLIGFYLIFKRKAPDFLTRRLIGFYILLAGVLLLTHVQVMERLLANTADVSILRLTWQLYFQYLDGTGTLVQTGGGMIGALLFTVSFFLFSIAGSRIVVFFCLLIGIIFMTNLSIGDFVKKVAAGFKATFAYFGERIQRSRANRAERREEEQKQKEIADTVVPNQEEAGNAVPEEQEYSAEELLINNFTDVAYQDQPEPEKNKGKTTPSKEKTANIDTEEETHETMPMTATENHDYQLPSMELLASPAHNSQQQEKSHIQATVRKLDRTFQSFGVKAKIAKVHVGPAVTKYEVYPESGVKVSKIVGLHDDIALALAAKDIRIEAPIPGKSAVGIEVPNKEISMVSLREVLDKQSSKANKLAFALGRDISGEAIAGELNKMPHLLIAGATGSGKSVCVNGIITSILMRAKPHEVKMMMIDPKKVELNVYNGIPHLLTPVVTDPKKASRALKKIVAEMERRYDLFSDSGTRNMEGYNAYIRKQNANAGEEEQQPYLPYIVVLVDELADLMMVASSDVEDAITRLAQMARAAGIHLIIATQRPSVDVITGVIKANIPSRIAFSVSSTTDSRTILDSGGAEKLLGRGDMLYVPAGSSKPTRVQGAFLSDEEVERIVDHCIEQQQASYQEEMIPEETNEVTEEVDDELYEDAVQMILEMQSASVSMLQRRFRIGYTRAARLIDAMEARGIVGPYEGSKPRSVLVSNQEEEHSTTS
ncbi:FtsK/SpoIIIE family DNA translocase [Oceanobacillus oncorhynchi]|uniref:DNA translocase SpoIIIE n=1 Tax=Oceanobacillus oncorhynchi TaxID=545501 RepID=A0A0A1MZU6_9BACI|nr:DNA translocase FtsK [Oceanobacillus oncorhynchi]UUI38557.1 DNA translocase FtsK [Oceanobacillus oncorhynchi]CEI84246.1 DNA translocase SpoIIIE [Oceanobacillus oncorhynchi]